MLWHFLCLTTAKQGLPYDQIGKPEHHLWGLLLLKMYGTEITMASKVGADEKTFHHGKLLRHSPLLQSI
jgi:hypothetical protein